MEPTKLKKRAEARLHRAIAPLEFAQTPPRAPAAAPLIRIKPFSIKNVEMLPNSYLYFKPIFFGIRAAVYTAAFLIQFFN